MVVTELTLNHIRLLAEHAPGLAKYSELKHQAESVLVVTHIFTDSELFRTRTFSIGTTINEINGIKVKNLQEYRAALQKGAGNKFLTILATDNVTRASDNIFVVLPMDSLLQKEPKLAADYHYPISNTIKEVMRIAGFKAESKQQTT